MVSWFRVVARRQVLGERRTMATPSMVSNEQATILLNIFDGSRQPIGPGVKNLLVRIIDGNQKQLSSDFRNGSNLQSQGPTHYNFGAPYSMMPPVHGHVQP